MSGVDAALYAFAVIEMLVALFIAACVVNVFRALRDHDKAEKKP